MAQGAFDMSTNKPSTTETEYFAKEEAEKLKRLALDRSKALASQEKADLKKLHWMHCPKCGMQLQEIIFKGHTLDKCFDCQGVYLDGPEFDSLAGSEGGIIAAIGSLFK